MTIEPLTPAVRLSSSNNPAVCADRSNVYGQRELDGGHADRYGKLPGRHHPTRPGDTLRGCSHADNLISERWFPFGECFVYAETRTSLLQASAALSQSILDFSLTPGSGSGGGSGSGSGSSVTTQTAEPGGSATYPLSIVPTAGTIFPTPVLLTVTGMPAGATPVITPSSWTQLTGNSWTFPANTRSPLSR